MEVSRHSLGTGRVQEQCTRQIGSEAQLLNEALRQPGRRRVCFDGGREASQGGHVLSRMSLCGVPGTPVEAWIESTNGLN